MVLAAQDGERVEQSRVLGAGKHEGGLARSLLGPEPCSAEVAIDVFAEKYGAKYDKAVECLTKDRETMLASTTSPPSTGITCGQSNPIESVLATVRRGIVAFVPQVQQKCISKKLSLTP